MAKEHTFSVFGNNYSVGIGDTLSFGEKEEGIGKIRVLEINTETGHEVKFKVKIIPPENDAEHLMRTEQWGTVAMGDSIESAANTDQFKESPITDKRADS